MSLFETLLTLGNVWVQAVEQHMPTDTAMCQHMQQAFGGLTQPHIQRPVVEEAIIAYFDQPPAHVAAVNSLDHSQFLNPLNIPGAGAICLRTVLETFSRKGPIPYGSMWLPLLDVAEKANPSQVRAREGREYIQQQMAVTTIPSAPSAQQLDNIMGSVLSAFPGLQECVGKIVQGTNSGSGIHSPRMVVCSRETDLNVVVDQVQNVLLGPLMQNLRAQNPDAPDITPALTIPLFIKSGMAHDTNTRRAGNNWKLRVL